MGTFIHHLHKKSEFFVLKMYTITKPHTRSIPSRKLRSILLISVFIAVIIFYCIFSTDLVDNSPKLIVIEAPSIELNDLIYEENPIGWKFNTSKHYLPNALYRYTKPSPVEHTFIPGDGENGDAFSRVEADDPEMKRLLDENNYNLMATEMMSLHRSLPDYRCDECKKMIYPKRLPKTSFILIFHDEAWSLILRTIWSIIERSPRELIEEIILVDDVSSWPVLHRPIEDYIELLPVPVRLIRTQKREGLIRARLIGAHAAKGPVLVFFDAHIEVTAGWLEPLLANIAEDRSLVAVPHIDWINSKTLKFDNSETYQYSRYSWGLGLYWSDIPERELIRTNHSKTALIRLPMHVGCAFAIDRDFFYEIGAYDEGMDIWGSENLELALRAWMCGGSLQLVQCSRVGHFYRVSTYSFDGSQNDIISRNSKRLAEVWMDDVKDFLYTMYPHMRTTDAGDLTERRKLRDRLQCKSFRWYLENLYPESRLGAEYIGFGELKNIGNDRCMDSINTNVGTKPIVYGCHQMSGNQFVAFTRSGLLITSEENICFGVSKESSTTPSVQLVECSENDQSQRWRYNAEKKTIQHIESGLCMQTVEDGSDIELAKCDASDAKFQWTLDHFKNN